MSEVGTALGEPASQQLLSKLAHFSVGLVQRDEGKGSSALGSGVLVNIDGRNGLLTCGHVADAFLKLNDIGVVRHMPGDQQRRILAVRDMPTEILESEGGWTEEGLDLAFTFFTPEVASSIASQSVFLNLDRNRLKFQTKPPENSMYADAILGLVAEFSDAPYIEGTEWISPMRGVLHTGQVVGDVKGLIVFEPHEANAEQLPESFGGMSGAGLWRAMFTTDTEGGVHLAEFVLCGIAAQERREKKQIVCQGWERIEGVLIPQVRQALK